MSHPTCFNVENWFTAYWHENWFLLNTCPRQKLLPKYQKAGTTLKYTSKYLFELTSPKYLLAIQFKTLMHRFSLRWNITHQLAQLSGIDSEEAPFFNSKDVTGSTVLLTIRKLYFNWASKSEDIIMVCWCLLP